MSKHRDLSRVKLPAYILAVIRISIQILVYATRSNIIGESK